MPPGMTSVDDADSRDEKMCAMSRRVRNMALDPIRHRQPELSDGEAHRMFIEMTVGVEDLLGRLLSQD